MGGAARCRGGREVWILPGGDVLVAPGNQVGNQVGNQMGNQVGNQVEQLLQTGKDIFSNCGGFNCCVSFELALQDGKNDIFVWYFFPS